MSAECGTRNAEQKARQQPLPGKMPASFEPLATISAARILTFRHGSDSLSLKDFGYDEEDIMADIEQGSFEWCFDIAAKKSIRREVRLYPPCVEQRVMQLQNPKWRVRSFLFDEVLRALFPNRNPRKPWVTSSPDVRLAFVCSPDLITDLIDEKELRQVKGTDYRRGRNGAALIEWESVKAFLEGRKL